MTVEEDLQPCEDIWIADSGASTHIVNSEEGLYETKSICEPVKIRDGKLVYATKIGRLKVFYETYDGEKKEFVLENVQYIPGFWINLFSLTAAMSKGCTISNEERMIVVTKKELKLKFNEEIKMKNGFVCGVKLAIKPAEDCSLATVPTADHHRPIDINKLHEELGHVSKTLVRKMAKFYGWMLKNKFETCESCALAKSRQKDTNKEKKAQSDTPGKRLFVDISHVKNRSFGGS